MKRLLLLVTAAIFWFPASTAWAAPPAVLNEKGQLALGNKRFFPVGMYEVAIPEMPAVPRESFNVVVDPYWAQGAQSTSAYLKAAHESGVLLIAGFPFEQVRTQDTRYIEPYVRAVKRDDHLLIWNVFEEPAGSHISVQQGEAAFQAIRKYDATRPILFVDFQVKNIVEYKNCYDIFAYDYYPIGTGSIVYWRNLFKSVVRAAQPKPVWAVIQAFGHADPKHDWVLPTPDEIRCMTYVAVIEGAQGILFYSHGRKSDPFYIRDHAAYWAFVRRLGAELQTLSPVLLSLAANERVSVENKSIDVTLRRCDLAGIPASSELYLVAANMAHKAPAVERHYPGVKQTDVLIVLKDVDDGQAELVGSAGVGTAMAGRFVPIHNGILTDSFDPYAVHLYRISSRGSR